MKSLGIIPARYASTRFPGKPLIDINGKSMIQRVWEQASKVESIDKVIVATDDQRIFDAVTRFGGEAMMTSVNCKTGTDRIAEVAHSFDTFDIIVNIQGDEPFIDPSQIETVISILKENPNLDISTLGKRISVSEQLFNENIVKLVKDVSDKALYFSRQPIPFLRNIEKDQWLKHQEYFKHIGLYAYRRPTLLKLATLEQTPLEIAESLEQLRWLENGFQIGIGLTEIESVGIDAPDDLKKI